MMNIQQNGVAIVLIALATSVVVISGTCDSDGRQCGRQDTDNVVLLQGKVQVQTQLESDGKDAGGLKANSKAEIGKNVFNIEKRVERMLAEVKKMNKTTVLEDPTGRDSIHTMNNLVNDIETMLHEQRDNAQTDINTAMNPFHESKADAEKAITLADAPGGVKFLQDKRDDYGDRHRECRTEEAVDLNNFQYARTNIDNFVRALGSLNNPPTIDKSNLDTVQISIAAKRTWIETEDPLTLFRKMRTDDEFLEAKHTDRRKECNTHQENFEMNFCEWRQALHNVEWNLLERYDAAKLNFEKASQDVRNQVQSMMTSYHGIKMIGCYLQVWLSDNDTSTATDNTPNCEELHESMDTSVMSVLIPPVPEMLKIETVEVEAADSADPWKVDMSGRDVFPGADNFVVIHYDGLQDILKTVSCEAPSTEAPTTTTQAPTISTEAATQQLQTATKAYSMVRIPDDVTSAACDVDVNSGDIANEYSVTNENDCTTLCMENSACDYATWWGFSFNCCYLFSSSACGEDSYVAPDMYGGVTWQKQA